MERMAAPLSEVIPILLDSHGKGKKIPMGDVAVAMLDCIQAMHENGNLFIDVKPENFMLSSTAAASSKRSKKTSNDVSQRVRLIDFGLVERWSDMSCSKHRENVEGAALVGTPAYASLNVMSGHTVSRRDDLEALGYVVAELILMLVSSGTKRKTKDANVLPWSHAVSDDELYQIKLQEMDKSKRSKSQFFSGLKAGGADAVMGNYFSSVRGLGYSEKPDYDSLRCYLKKLIITVAGASGGSKQASSSPKKATKLPARRRSTRRKHEEEDDDSIEMIDENVENHTSSGKKQKVSVAKESVPRRSIRSTRNSSKTREIGTQTDEMDVINVDSSDDEEDTMDWEHLENNEPAGTDAKETGTGILKLDVIEGPHRGKDISFGGDHPDTVLVGRDPDSHAMKDGAKFALSKDDTASGALAKFVLASKKDHHSVRVTDMSSSNQIFVKGSILPKGKSRQAFVGDKIKIGESVLQIRKA
ncbi:hypothetical protein ACHAXR_003768 [Thalassiosira sp. AJA248-18]